MNYLKNIKRRLINMFPILFDPLAMNLNKQEDVLKLARIVRKMAETGIGTDACLELGCLPMLVNFYSAVPDIKDLKNRHLWDKRRNMVGIDFQPERQLAFLAQLGREYGDECKWPLKPTNNPTEFYLDNGNFSFGCAASLHVILRHFQPHCVVEIGSGNSSKVISKALSLNANKSEYNIIDPYPNHVTKNKLPCVTQLIERRVELVDLDFFCKIGKDDILFIDSGHTVRTGSDVNFLILEVLPRLAPGAIVHFHDINMPYEYPEVYFTNPQFRVFWTEDYLLQAFLTHNSQFEILLALSYLQANHMDIFCQTFPHFDLSTNWATSGSFWIRRRLS